MATATSSYNVDDLCIDRFVEALASEFSIEIQDVISDYSDYSNYFVNNSFKNRHALRIHRYFLIVDDTPLPFWRSWCLDN
jgi:hypothetical protein